jgi:hypothetical protein
VGCIENALPPGDTLNHIDAHVAPDRRKNFISSRQGWIVRMLILLIAGLIGCSGDASRGPTGNAAPSPTVAPTPSPTPSPAPTPAMIHFVPNSHDFWSNPANWTTSYGPAYANIILAPSNFLPCLGGPFALCYYSGPSSGAEDLSCTLTPDGLYANCNCYNIVHA